MKLAISNIAWDPTYDQEMYVYLEQMNISGIEIAPTRIFPENPYNNIKRAKEYSNYILEYFGLHVVSMQSIWFGRKENIFEGEKQRELLLEYTKKAFEFAITLGCSNLVFGCPKNRNMNSRDDISIAIDFFEKLGGQAARQGVVLAIEANPSIYGTNFLNTTKEAVEFLKLVGSDSVRLNYDLGTVLQNLEDIADIQIYADDINHIHISEPNLEEIIFSPLHKELFKHLRNIDYNKYVSLEMKNLGSIDLVKCKVKQLIEEGANNAATR